MKHKWHQCQLPAAQHDSKSSDYNNCCRPRELKQRLLDALRLATNHKLWHTGGPPRVASHKDRKVVEARGYISAADREPLECSLTFILWPKSMKVVVARERYGTRSSHLSSMYWQSLKLNKCRWRIVGHPWYVHPELHSRLQASTSLGRLLALATVKKPRRDFVTIAR